VEFEPTISAGERPQTDALDRAATETGSVGLKAVYFPSVTLCIVCITQNVSPFWKQKANEQYFGMTL
jgi:uncharacterized iron-regulated protein